MDNIGIYDLYTTRNIRKHLRTTHKPVMRIKQHVHTILDDLTCVLLKPGNTHYYHDQKKVMNLDVCAVPLSEK